MTYYNVISLRSQATFLQGFNITGGPITTPDEFKAIRYMSDLIPEVTAKRMKALTGQDWKVERVWN